VVYLLFGAEQCLFVLVLADARVSWPAKAALILAQVGIMANLLGWL
jgi:hypothetical protein